MRVKTDKQIKKDLDKAWADAVRHRDKACLMCGKTSILHAHHWFIRKARSVAIRWELDNGATLCYYCHLCQLHRYSDREFMQKFFLKMDELVSGDRQIRLAQLAASKWDFKKMDTTAILASLLTGQKA